MRRECGSEALEPEDMKLLAEHTDKQLAELKAQEKIVTLQVKWHLLYKVSKTSKLDFKKKYSKVNKKNVPMPFAVWKKVVDQ